MLFSFQQSLGNTEWKNGLVKGHAYTVTGAREVSIVILPQSPVLSTLVVVLLVYSGLLQ